MAYFVWSLPIFIVAALIVSGRASSAQAGCCGLAVAIVVVLTSAPNSSFTAPQAVLAMARGVWLGLLVGAVILGGLFFREAISGATDATELGPIPIALRRQQLYSSCFLVGPFAEAATGFGLGQVTIAPVLKRIEVTPMNGVIFGLFSQVMVPWGALANGTIVGAELAGLSPSILGLHSAQLTGLLLFTWLCLFWRLAAAAGVSGSCRDFISEAAFTMMAVALLILANMKIGPEVAAMAALGPLIAARFVFDLLSGRSCWRTAFHVGVPYAILIAGLAATRAIQPVNQFLSHAVVVRPFADGAIWLPLLHPGSWLLAVGLMTALFRGEPIGAAFVSAWRRGKKAVATIVLFLAMAQVMVASGVASGIAGGLRSSLGVAAVLATPVLASLFGFITSSSSATNGLLMPAQAALAQATHLSLSWLAAVQNVAAAAATMLSPVRLAMGCALVGRPDLERSAYAHAWPLGVIPLVILIGATIALAC
ncbi:lactate permease [Enhydrobacter aerosaccus]|uniref:L-lactate permease n=1 Tax=Enhydrobacter aerosaccus TaxID=225324 RepID=A0A1T4KPN7_9HYPH|nr:L-lactate permease [Enhydrobacter aerosaccus]SJZ44297.1 lactate permease [Enhydrobacter aerosaccus]